MEVATAGATAAVLKSRPITDVTAVVMEVAIAAVVRKITMEAAMAVVIVAVKLLWTEVVGRKIMDAMEVVIRDAGSRITDATAVAIADVKNKRLQLKKKIFFLFPDFFYVSNANKSYD